MARIGKWGIGSVVIVVAVTTISLFAAREVVVPATRGVCTVGFNYRERPIYWFGVATAEAHCGNNVGGKRPDAAYAGGGGVACGCAVRPGEQAVVKWSFDQPLDEIERHIPSEEHQTQVTIPQPESARSRYLQVHFLADNRVVLDWRDSAADSRINPNSGAVDEQQR